MTAEQFLSALAARLLIDVQGTFFIRGWDGDTVRMGIRRRKSGSGG